MKAGTQITVKGFDMEGDEFRECAKVARTTKDMLPMPQGYVPVLFADGSKMLVPSERIATLAA